MARPRTKNSKASLNHYGLTREEDKQLEQLCDAKGVSVRSLTKALLRAWIKAGGPGGFEFIKQE